MKRRVLLIMCLVFMSGAAAAKVVRYTLPEETQPTLPAGTGAELVVAQCASCHSLDYVLTQPRGKGRVFWDASVTKMVKIYGAPITPADGETISAYLARHY